MNSQLMDSSPLDFSENQKSTWLAARLGGLAQRIGETPTAMLVALCAFLFSLFMIFPVEPAYLLLGGRMDHKTYGDLTYTSRFYFSYLPISEDLGVRTQPEYLFTRHRILGPIIAHLLHLRGRMSAVVPVGANFFLLWAIYAALRKRRLPHDLCASTVFTLSLTLIVATSQAWVGYQDSLGCLAIALALWTDSIPLAALAFLIGMFAEERILIAGPLFVIWHALDDASPRWFGRAVLRSISLVVVLGLWLGYYFALHRHLNITTKDVTSVAFEDFRQYKSYVWPGFYYGLRAAWLLPAMLIGRWLLERGRRTAAALMLFSILMVLAVSLRVGDISRVCCLAFPAVLLAAVYLYRGHAASARYYMLGALMLNVVSPCLSITQYHVRFFYPLPIAVPQLIHELHHPD